MTTILYIFTFAIGSFCGGFLVYKFNPKDITVNGKNKVKWGGVIDFGVDFGKPQRKKIV